MTSVIRGSDNFDTAGGNAVKAWVNFNGTGTVAIRASYNVSSITDNGVGDYTVNFTTAMSDVNYSVQVSVAFNGGANLYTPYLFTTNALAPAPPTVSAARLSVRDSASVASDSPYVCIGVFR